MRGLIYVATNRQNGLRYIGQTSVTLTSRRQKHLDSTRGRSDTYFHNAVRVYGIDTFDFVEIDSADSQEELDYMERYWMAFYRTRDRVKGYNTKDGGQLSYGPIPDIVKAKISAANIGQKRSPESRAKMAERKGGTKTQSTHPYVRKHHSPTTEFPSARIRCVETGEVFLSVTAAARHLGVSHSNFPRLRRNPKLTVQGLHWEFLS